MDITCICTTKSGAKRLLISYFSSGKQICYLQKKVNGIGSIGTESDSLEFLSDLLFKLSVILLREMLCQNV